MATNKNTSRMRMWPFLEMSLSDANFWFDVSNMVLIASLVFGVVSTLAIVRLTLVKERHWERDRDAARMQIKSLEIEQDKARAELVNSIKQTELAKTVGAQAKERAAQAQERAAAAELKLAEFRKNRAVGPKDVSKIVDKIQAFSGTKFDIGHSQSGREQWDFLWQLEPVLPKAGWVFVDWNGPQIFAKVNWTMSPHWYGVANVLNVSLEISPECRDTLFPAAQALADVLNDIGIIAAVEPRPISNSSRNHDAIHLLVGEKR
jgi:hypothetical protein